MPSKEIKELRQLGKLEEAYTMASEELQADPTNLWAKRNMSWVLYTQLDSKASSGIADFISKIEEVKSLELPSNEEMFFENICIVIAKAARAISGNTLIDYEKLYHLFDAIKELPFHRNSKWYSVMLGALHKAFKESFRYTELIDWWNLENLRPEDFQKETLPNGKEMMSLSEQVYIAYAKHLLPKQTQFGEVIFDRDKVEVFMPLLDELIENYPDFQYPPYFKAKLLLATGDHDNVLSAFLPFAKKKRNDFWVWDVLSEVFEGEEDKIIACYSKALSCRISDDFLINIRQKMATILIGKQLFNEAKTEIIKLVKARSEKGWPIPSKVVEWQNQQWFQQAVGNENNFKFYRKHLAIGDDILFGDIQEQKIFVNFVNSDKKMLNFIDETGNNGFFKYENLLFKVEIGQVLWVRFNGNGNPDGAFKVFTAKTVVDNDFKNQFIKIIEGTVRKNPDKEFAFLQDTYLHPTIVSKCNLQNEQPLKIEVIKKYDRNKKEIVWSFLKIV